MNIIKRCLVAVCGVLSLLLVQLPTAAAADNLVPNPSVETVSASNSSLPADWVSYKEGTNTTAFTYLTMGHTGTRSLKVQMTAHNSGDAHYKFTPQTVTPGAKYDFSFWYQSDVTTEVDAEVTLASGSTTWIYLGDVPASAAWKQYTASVTMPTNAAKATVYATIYSVGSLITDDYSFSSQSATPTAAAPTFSPAAGSYTSAQTVTLTSATAGAKLYYTTNGATPTTASSLYTAPLTVSATTTLKAIAVATGYANSAVVSATYTIGSVTSTAATPTFSLAAGTYTGVQSLGLNCATNGASIYYTTNGTTPTTASSLYTGPISVAKTTTVKALAVLSGYKNSAVASAKFTIKVPTPTFTPAAGTYAGTQTVAITDAMANAKLYYTTNGRTPTTSSTPYSAPITLSATKTVKVLAVVAGCTNSAVATAKFIITAPTAAAPTFSPAGGTYTSAQTVTLTSATAGAKIYYTTNGTTPTTASSLYAAPLTVSATTTLKAIAVATGYANSAVASATYTINIPQAATPTFSPAAGVYTSAQSVSLASVTPGAQIYYTTDGSTPTNASNLYTGPLNVGSSMTIKALATASGYTDSAVASATYTINLPTAGAPNFSPAGGTYTSAQSVSISSSTPGAQLYYTLDGSAPTATSNLYASPLAVAASTTLKAIAVASGYLPSPVATAVYTIELPVAAAPTFTPAAGTYTSIQTVSLASTTSGASIYYTLDGTTPSSASSLYTVPLTIGSNTTLTALATAAGYRDSAPVSAVYTITIPQAATPTFSPAAGTYTSAQTVALSSATAGAQIYYTTDGSTPTSASSLYVSPLTVSTTTTLQAIALATGYADSAVATGVYTINTAAPTAFNLIQDDTVWDDLEGGEGSVVTTDKVVGASSVKITTVTRSAYNGLIKDLAASPLALSGTALRLYVKSSDWSKVAVANLLLGSDGYTLANTYTYDLKSQLQNPANGEWIEVVIPRSAFVDVYGAPNWNSINFLMLRLKDSGSVADLALDGLSSFSAAAPAGVVSITFDDGWADTYTQGKANMDTYGFKGTAFLIPDLLNTTGYLTDAQVAGLGSGGWDLGGHSDLNLTTLSTTALQSELAAAKDRVAGQQGSELFAYPYGATDDAVMAALPGYFTYGFNINGMNQPLPYQNRLSINRQSMDMWTTPAMIAEWIDQAKNNQEWTILNFHTLVNSPTQSYDFSINDFKTVLAYLQSSGVAVKPISEVLGLAAPTTVTAAPTFSPAGGTYASAQTVTLTSATAGAQIYYTTDGATPTIASSLYAAPLTVSATTTLKAFAAAPGRADSAVVTAAYTIGAAPVANLVPNPSLETASGSAPADWLSDKSGTNTTTFTYLTTGHTGTRSVKVTTTAYTSGDAYYKFAAQPVAPNTEYDFSFWYQSDVYTEIYAEITDNGGNATYQYLGYSWPSSTWNQFATDFTTPAAAASVSVYAGVVTKGYLTTDDYFLGVRPTPAPLTRALVTLTYDEMNEHVYTYGYPLFTQYNTKGNLYFLSSQLGATGMMNQAQLLAYKDLGFEIGSHTVNHSYLPQVTAAALDAELKDSQSALSSYFGTSVNSFASPYGEYNPEVIAGIKQYYANHRSTDAMLNTKDNFDPYRINAYSIESDMTADYVKALIDKAVAEKAWLVLVYHDIRPDDGSGDLWTTTPANMEAVLAYLQTQGVATVTTSQAVAEIQSQL